MERNTKDEALVFDNQVGEFRPVPRFSADQRILYIDLCPQASRPFIR